MTRVIEKQSVRLGWISSMTAEKRLQVPDYAKLDQNGHAQHVEFGQNQGRMGVRTSGGNVLAMTTLDPNGTMKENPSYY